MTKDRNAIMEDVLEKMELVARRAAINVGDHIEARKALSTLAEELFRALREVQSANN